MHFFNSAVTRFLSLTIIFLIALHLNGWAQQSASFDLIADPVNTQSDSIQKNILEIKQAINKSDQWKDFSLTGEHPAVGILNQLVDEQEIRSLFTTQKVYLINDAENTYQVRDLFVKTARTDTLEYRQIVLRFNEKAQLIDADFAPNRYNYQQVLDRKINPHPDKQHQVKRLIERFQQGLVNNDAQTIRGLLDPNTQLTEGSIVRYEYNGQFGPYYHYQSVPSQKYLQELKEASIPPAIHYDQLKVYKHTFLEEVYVATFKQTWQRNAYSDTGYIAMVIDLGKDHPVQLRRWQEHPYDKGRLEHQLNQPSKMAAFSQVSTAEGISQIKPLILPIKQKRQPKKTTFFDSKKNRWIILAGTTATAVSVGIAILSGGESGGLPNPPGRPALR